MVPLNIVFMGTAPLAAVSLRALIKEPAFKVLNVVTQPDRPKGRDLQLQPSAVKVVALEHGLPVSQPQRARDEAFIQTLKTLAPNLIVVAAYGQILPQSILDLPRYGCINVHASLLPRWRGAAPIQWAILSGDAQTGVTIMKMDAGLDTGDMLTKVVVPIAPQDNSETLHDRLAEQGAELLVNTIPRYVAGAVQPQKQPAEGVTYARKITKEDGHLNWNLPANDLWNRLRALTPWPGAFTHLTTDAGKRMLKIWEAEVVPAEPSTPGQVLSADKHGIVVACGQSALRIKTIQREGGRRLSAHDYLVGHPLSVGTMLA